MQEEGPGSLLSLAVRIKSTDPKKQHVINRRSLQEISPFLQQDHLNIIFRELSQNDKDIDYSLLIYDLKGQVDEERLKDIEGAFNSLDNRREGEFPIHYMVSRYLSKSYKEHFQRSVDLYVKFQGIDDGVFT